MNAQNILFEYAYIIYHIKCNASEDIYIHMHYDVPRVSEQLGASWPTHIIQDFFTGPLVIVL